MKKLLLTIVASILCAGFVSAQESLEVNNPKPGKLGSVINKNSYGSLKKLTITGFLNNKDIEVISNLANLEELDFSQVDLNYDDYKKGKLEYYDRYVLRMPSLAKLEKLSVAGGHYELKFSSVPSNLKELYVANETEVNTPLTLNVYGINDIGGEIYGLVSSYEKTFENIYRRGEQCKLELYNASKPIKAKYLVFPRNDYFREANNRSYENVNPNIIICKKEGKTILNHWDDNFDPSVLNEITELNNGAFAGCNLSNIKLPKAIKEIPRHCFNGCANLQTVDLSEIETIHDYAFVNSGIKDITLSSNLKKIYRQTFTESNIETVELLGNYPPEIVECKYEQYSIYEHNCTWVDYTQRFIVPKGRLDAYNIGAWKRASLREIGGQSGLKISVQEPGTLSAQLTDEVTNSLEELTIEGLLYDTDFLTIQKCKNLRVIDISRCYIVKSPKTKKEDAQVRALENAIIADAVDKARTSAQKRFAAGTGTLAEVAVMENTAEEFRKYMESYNNNDFAADDRCYLPPHPFEGMLFIEKIVLPNQLKRIDTWLDNSNALKEVVLPPYLEVLDTKFSRGFSSKANSPLAKINLPATLRVIGDYTFKDCKKLEIIDLSTTQVTTIGKEAFKGCESLKVFKGSKYLKTINGYDAFKFDGSGKVKGYFYTPEEPSKLSSGSFSEIHIIRGTKAGWSRTYNTTLIDDLEE